jgi:uncharacterized membrane protein YgcG
MDSPLAAPVKERSRALSTSTTAAAEPSPSTPSVAKDLRTAMDAERGGRVRVDGGTLLAHLVATPNFSENAKKAQVKPSEATQLRWSGPTGAERSEASALSFLQWWLELWRTVRRFEWTEQQTLAAITLHLHGEARSLLTNLDVESFEEFRKAAARRYLHDTTVDQVRAMVHRVEQRPGEPASAYLDRKVNVWRPLAPLGDALPERALVESFVTGLSSAWCQLNQAIVLEMRKKRTVDEVRDLLAAVARTVQEPPTPQSQRGRGGRGGGGRMSERGGGSERQSASGGSNAPDGGGAAGNTGSTDNRRCWDCGELGHVKKDPRCKQPRSHGSSTGKALGEEAKGRSSSPKH